MNELEQLKKINELNVLFLKVIELENLKSVKVGMSDMGYISPLVVKTDLKNEKAKKLCDKWFNGKNKLFKSVGVTK